jgi:hypothetical protein
MGCAVPACGWGLSRWASKVEVEPAGIDFTASASAAARRYVAAIDYALPGAATGRDAVALVATLDVN